MKTFSTNGTSVLQHVEGGTIAHYRPDYTPEERQQVADWMNGQDQPLPLINVADRPYPFPGREDFPIMRPMDREYRVD